MKFSIFNYYLEEEPDVHIFNTKIGLVESIPQQLYQQIKNNQPISKQYTDMTNLLMAEGIIVDEQINELYDLEQEYKKNQLSNDTASIIIAPSLGCNFDCAYCYERKNNNKMSEDDLDKVVNLIENNYLTSVNNVFFSWFGGEPTLNFNLIEKYTNILIKKCKNNNVKYKFIIITNGYLLNDTFVKFYKSISDNLEICITIDGLKSEHDKRRYLKNKEKTFDIIIENLKTLIDNKINTTVRINIDSENIISAKHLIDYLIEQNAIPSRIYLGHIQNYTSSCQINNALYLTKQEFASVSANTYDYMVTKGLRKYSILYEGPKKTFCKANCKNSVIFDPNLYMYKCENDIGRKELAFANSDGELTNRYADWSPFKFEKCRSCPLLPSCFGGCAFTAIQYKEPQCPAFKYTIEDDFKDLIKILKRDIE